MIERVAPLIALSRSSSSSDDSGGSRESGDTGSSGSGSGNGAGADARHNGYNSHDAANDGAVADMVEQSRRRNDATT